MNLRLNLQQLMKLQEKLCDLKFDRTLITILGDEYLVPTDNLEMFIEDLIISTQNGSIK
jgi:hypothetical protein